MKAKGIVLMASIVLCSAGPLMGQTAWQQYPGNPVIGPGDPGTWDESGVAVLAVVFYDGAHHMWYTSYSPDEEGMTDVGHATSPDGIDWTRDPDPVLTRGAPGEWDERQLWGAAVIHDGTQFHMWYEGEDAAGIFRCGYATSPDGSVWTKYAGNPVMVEGEPGSWDFRGVGPKTVIVDGDRYRMWYHGTGGQPSGIRLFHAESSNGINWTKHGPPVLDYSEAGWDSAWLANPVVIFDGSIYHMWYGGSDVASPAFEDGKSIGYASSPDGIAWTKFDGNPLVEASSGYAHTYSAVFDGSTFHMWYTYFDGGLYDYVNYATSEVAGIGLARFIPGAAAASGAHGSFFQTDVDVSNAGGQSLTYHFVWLPRGEDNSDPLTSETFSLGAGMSVRYGNVLNAVFGLEPDALGALAIVTSSPDLLAMSRIFNSPSAKTAGTYGQAMPAIPTGDFISSGERRRILFASEHADMRTNVGCQNGGTATTVVKLELFDAAGTHLETRQMTLAPLSNKQYNRVFEAYQPVDGYVDVWTATTGGSFYCYGSVADNVTSDPTTILPQ
jgi:predicted GH43/DUF377 family glycosyl hydrolase